MAISLLALCIDAHDPTRLAHFWAGLLGRELAEDPHDGVVLLPDDDTGFRIRFVATEQPEVGPNLMHLHLTSTSHDDQQSTVDRALALGGRHIDVGQLPDEDHVVLADPEGNAFCVIEAGNNFLAGCGFLGELACDGSREVGHFWSEALGWPLVWDQAQETAVQSPGGGTKIAWGGPPQAPKTGTVPQHFDLAAPTDGDLQAEVDRLVSLGATRVDHGQGDVRWVVLADPDGREFCVHPSG